MKPGLLDSIITQINPSTLRMHGVDVYKVKISVALLLSDCDCWVALCAQKSGPETAVVHVFSRRLFRNLAILLSLSQEATTAGSAWASIAARPSISRRPIGCDWCVGVPKELAVRTSGEFVRIHKCTCPSFGWCPSVLGP